MCTSLDLGFQQHRTWVGAAARSLASTWALGHRGSPSLPRVLLCPASLTPPSVFPLSLASSDSSDRVILGCLVKDFIPLPAEVSWEPTAASFTNFPPVFGAGGLYTMSSQLSLTPDQCQEQATCKVLHNKVTKTVNLPCKGQRAARAGGVSGCVLLGGGESWTGQAH